MNFVMFRSSFFRVMACSLAGSLLIGNLAFAKNREHESREGSWGPVIATAIASFAAGVKFSEPTKSTLSRAQQFFAVEKFDLALPQGFEAARAKDEHVLIYDIRQGGQDEKRESLYEAKTFVSSAKLQIKPQQRLVFASLVEFAPWMFRLKFIGRMKDSNRRIWYVADTK